MAFSKSISLVALLSLAFLACSFVASPANAVSVDAHHYVRRDHAAIAKKRSTSISATKRCKPRPASSTSTTTTVSTPKPSVKSVSLPPKTTSAPAPSSAPAQPQPSSTSGSGKRCLGWANGDDPALAKWAHGKADLLYTWSAYLPSNTYGLQGVPMLWGPTKLAEFQKLVVQGYASIAMGFNEPDVPSQSNMAASFAAEYWQQHMNPLKALGYTLVSPATVTGTDWMKAFFEACNGKCHVDILAVHWYGNNFADLQTRLEDFHSAYPNMPIWLTEVACQSFTNAPQCNNGQVWELMNALKAYETTSWLAKWCWFGAMHDMVNVNPLNQLMAADGSPNALGDAFLY